MLKQLHIIANAWSNYWGLQITELEKNLFLFSFAKDDDRTEVLRKAPWFIMNHLLCLESWLPHVAYHHIEFKNSPFWIQIHNPPLELMNVTKARKLTKSWRIYRD